MPVEQRLLGNLDLSLRVEDHKIRVATRGKPALVRVTPGQNARAPPPSSAQCLTT